MLDVFKMKKLGIFAGGVLFGTAGVKLLSSKDAKKVYTNCTAAVLRAKDSVMKTASTVQENAEDILAEAKQINEERAAKEAALEQEAVREKAEYVSLDRLIRESDIITLHAPATDDNYHMIDTQAIQKMKDGVIIINCARGALIDTDALIEGIENGKVGFAGLDVVEHESGLYYFNRMGEPLGNPKLAILRSYSNVVVTPHTAFYTDEAVSNMAENSIIGAMKFISGEHSSFEVR